MRTLPVVLHRRSHKWEKRAGLRGLEEVPRTGFCSHKLILGEVDENVHLIILHHAEDRADVVVLQHGAIIVQDCTF